MIGLLLRQYERARRAGLSRLRRLYFRQLGVAIEPGVWLQAVEIPRNWSDITLERGALLDRGVVLLCSGPPRARKLTIGAGTYVNRYTMFDAHERVEIGPGCMIGPHCYVTDGNHGMQNDVPVNAQPMTTAPVRLGAYVWLGAGVQVLAGVVIGDHAVIGAGSVVTRDVPAHAIAVGAPARVVRYRHDA